MTIEIFSRPEFYDIFGLSAFISIITIAIWSIKKKKRLPKLANYLLLAIGIIGALVDAFFVFRAFF